MAKRIFITATNTDIGKTYTTKLLLNHYATKGYSVGVMKPIETGVVNDFAPDASILLDEVKRLNSNFKNLKYKDITPITYELPAAPSVASNNKKIDLKKIDETLQKLEQLCDIILIEGAGGLFVPVDEDMMMIDLITHFDATALLVTHCSLGCINDTLLSVKALKDYKIKHTYAFNCKEEDKSFSVVSEPYFLNSSQKVLKVSEDIDTLSELLYNF